MLKRSFKYVLPILALLFLVIVVKGVYNIGALELLVGGMVGMFLPDLDHFVYIYFLRPQELTCQRVKQALSRGQYRLSVNLIMDSHNERIELIFHTALFHIVFFVLSFLVITSSGSIFGRGLVLAALMHLTIDQYLELKAGRGGGPTVFTTGQPQGSNKQGIHNWFNNLGVALTLRQEKFYLWGMFALTLVLALVF